MNRINGGHSQNFLLPVLILWMEIKPLLIPESVIPLALTLPEPEDNEKSFKGFLSFHSQYSFRQLDWLYLHI